MLSSDSLDAETIGSKTSDSNLDNGSQSTLTGPLSSTSKSVFSSTVPNKDKNITSNLLSAFTTKFTSNSFSSSINPPFDYNFSRNKKPLKYTNTSDEVKSTSTLSPVPVPAPPTTKDKGKDDTVLTFTDFLKKNYSKSVNTPAAATTNDNTNNNNNDKTVSSFIPPSSSSSKLNTKPTPKLSIITKKDTENSKKKSNEATKADANTKNNNDMDVDKNADTTLNAINVTNDNPYNDIWLNPEVFAAPSEDQDEPMTEVYVTAPTTANLEMDTMTSTQQTTTNKILPNTLSLSGENQPNDGLYDRYVNENSDILKEKLQQTLKEEKKKTLP